MKRIEKKHPLAIRWFHWINFPVLTGMIWSGLLIYWANDVYRVGWGDRFYAALHVDHRLADLLVKHPPATRSGDPADVARRPHDLLKYVSLSLPDDSY